MDIMELARPYITLADIMALIGAVLCVITLMVQTIVPLRILSIFSNVFLFVYGVLAGAPLPLLQNLLSIPVNFFRLRQMQKLIKKARVSTQGDLSMDWLRPFMTPRRYKKGDVLFRKGDAAKEMFLTVTGKFNVTEIGVELSAGCMIGELGFVNPENRRTQTVECTEAGEVLTISYEKLLGLYFQNPEFGYYFLRLTSERLMQNITWLEGIIESNKEVISRLEGVAVEQKRLEWE